MANLLRCADCGSFAPLAVCPHCASPRVGPTKLGALATVLGSSAFAMTLMACYGNPNLGDAPDYTGPTYGGASDGGADGGPPVPLDGSIDAEAGDADTLDAAAGDASADAQAGDAGLDAAVDAGSAQDAAVSGDDASTDAASGS